MTGGLTWGSDEHDCTGAAFARHPGPCGRIRSRPLAYAAPWLPGAAASVRHATARRAGRRRAAARRSIPRAAACVAPCGARRAAGVLPGPPTRPLDADRHDIQSMVPAPAGAGAARARGGVSGAGPVLEQTPAGALARHDISLSPGVVVQAPGAPGAASAGAVPAHW